jgi:hypothetical protein
VGYYITFVFDPGKDKFDRNRLIERFVEAGAYFIEDRSDKAGGYYSCAGHLLSFGDYPHRSLKKGYYADIRFSWGTDSDYLKEKLTEILDVADRLGCRVYDGQLDIWITRENVESIAEGFVRQASSVIKMLGTIDKKKYSQKTKESQQKMDKRGKVK